MTKIFPSLQNSFSNIWEDYVQKTHNIKSKPKAKYRMSGCGPRYKVTYEFRPKYLKPSQIYCCTPNHWRNKKFVKKNKMLQKFQRTHKTWKTWFSKLLRNFRRMRSTTKKMKTISNDFQ